MVSYRVWPATDGSSFATEDDPVNLGTEFYVTQQAWLTHLHIWRFDSTMSGTILGRVWIASGGAAGTALNGTDVTFDISGTGWRTATLPAPVELTPLVRYRASMLAPSGYTGTNAYWTAGPGSGGITNGLLVAPSSGPNPDQSSKQGSFTYCPVPASPTREYPDSTFQGGNYWVDVTVSDVFPAPVGGNMSISDTARINMISALGYSDAQARVLTNVDLMRLVIAAGGLSLVTVTDATAAIHLEKYLRFLRSGV